ncbi:hypothetical protein EDD27_8898 [Nonomuraea polychroma]|uniref:Glyoxalase/bleomycin resistance protein/dioxygenase superfamily protein n=1 Tax=Nonomuraea polychroma TaxID=46176 RepID=A0A438MKE5_9ACTN|nr:hypothetical protein [Nonomuraea polychroma]RVX46055.1 hypothetical protein EDD27_8898 [Nonomuraea polychroma]
MSNRYKRLLATAAATVAAAVCVFPVAAMAEATDRMPKPTIILEHGAFADGSSWNRVIAGLRRDGYPVLAAANPLRGVASDAATLRGLIAHIDGPLPSPGEAGRVPGFHPERASYGSFASFHDPDGNLWFLQEVTQRAPGR